MKFEINEEVLAYDILGKLHKAVIKRRHTNDYGINLYEVLLNDPLFIIQLDEIRIKKVN